MVFVLLGVVMTAAAVSLVGDTIIKIDGALHARKRARENPEEADTFTLRCYGTDKDRAEISKIPAVAQALEGQKVIESVTGSDE